jgi:hypothetical protein
MGKVDRLGTVRGDDHAHVREAAEAAKTAEEAKSAAAVAKRETASLAADAAKAAEAGRADAAKAVHEAKLAIEPVSVFVSRATQRLYVRRATRIMSRRGSSEVDVGGRVGRLRRHYTTVSRA